MMSHPVSLSFVNRLLKISGKWEVGVGVLPVVSVFSPASLFLLEKNICQQFMILWIFTCRYGSKFDPVFFFSFFSVREILLIVEILCKLIFLIRSVFFFKFTYIYLVCNSPAGFAFEQNLDQGNTADSVQLMKK